MNRWMYMIERMYESMGEWMNNIPSSLSLDLVSQHPLDSRLQQHLQLAEGSVQLAEPIQKPHKGTLNVISDQGWITVRCPNLMK